MTLKIGLIGGGPWAHKVHAPSITAHPATTLTGVWTRRLEVAAAMAGAHGGTAYRSVEELFDEADAVAFAVPPAVQAQYAVAAANRGKHLILEKPIAPELASAQRIADAVTAADVASLVMFTRRFAPETREWLAAVHERDDWQGGTATWLSGALLGGDYQDSAWRRTDGAVADIGPHVLDLLDAALGPITAVLAAHRSADDLWQLLVAHEGERTSTITLSLRIPVEPTQLQISAIGADGVSALVGRETPAPDAYRTLLDELVTLVETGETRHPCDVQRGLYVQRLLHMVTAVL